MATAKVFKSGNSQAVRLPKEFRIKSATVEISRRGNQIILTEKPVTLGDLLDRITPDPDFLRDVVIDDPPPQKRKWL
jgi:antitoxin VapB